MVKKKKLNQTYLNTANLVTRLVQIENERLTRLLRNLYQEFRLGKGDRSEIYSHICRELAQYFHCDCCELYLVKHNFLEKECRVTETLELTAAFGPWEQALKPKYVRRIIPTYYDLDESKKSSHSVSRFNEDVAIVDLCRCDYRTKNKNNLKKKNNRRKDSEWHLVWYRNNLYSISRNILTCPIFRHRSRGSGRPYRIGLLKLENRRPFVSKAFDSDYPTNRLYFSKYFELFAVSAYIEDLRKRVMESYGLESLFTPLHDSDGWRQHFQENPAGQAYFEEILKWQEDEKNSFKNKRTEYIKSRLIKKYENARNKLSAIMNFVVEAEVLLQELTVGCSALLQETKRSKEFNNALDRLPVGAPVPSFFNVVGITKAKEDVEWLRDIIFTVLNINGKDIQQSEERIISFFQNLVNKFIWIEDTKPTSNKRNHADLFSRLKIRFSESNSNSGGLFSEEKCEALIKFLCDCLRKIACKIQKFRKSTDVPIIAPNTLTVYQCADKVLESMSDEHEENSVSLRYFAKASAVASMFAHTFDPRLDTTRLLSIQSHVSQVMDNYLMDRIRLLNLTGFSGLNFDHIEILGLMESSIDELHRLHRLLEETAHNLKMVVQKRLKMIGSPDSFYTISSSTTNINLILGNLVEEILNSSTKNIKLIEVQINPAVHSKIKSFPHDKNLFSVSFTNRSKLVVQLRPSHFFAGRKKPSIKDNNGNRPIPIGLYSLNTALKELNDKLIRAQNKIRNLKK